MESDAVVFQRPASPEWLNFIKVAQKAGKVIVCDYDDDPFHVNPMNPSYKYNGIEEVAVTWEDGKIDMLWKNGEGGFDVERNIRHMDLFRASFKRADLITCTTPVLHEIFKKINPNCEILPNVIDVELYPSCEFVKKEVRILWQGGSSHYEDLYIVHKQIVNILKKYPTVKFVYFGDMRFVSLFKDAPQNQIEYHGWVSHKTYPYKLATMNCDIGLCPVADNEFNRCKSSIKWMEYSTQKMATIASDITPYNVDIEKDVTGILVNDSEWFDAMERLIADKLYREALARNAYNTVCEKYNANTKAHLWRDAYDKVLKKELLEV